MNGAETALVPNQQPGRQNVSGVATLAVKIADMIKTTTVRLAADLGCDMVIVFKHQNSAAY